MKKYCHHEGYLGYGDGRQHQHPGPRGTRLIAIGRVRVCDKCGADFCQHCADGADRRLDETREARKARREAREAEAAKASWGHFDWNAGSPFDPAPLPQPSAGPWTSR